MLFGRTELITSVSRAKNCEQSAGDVCFGVAPQKPTNKSDNRDVKKSNEKMSGGKIKCWESSETPNGALFQG